MAKPDNKSTTEERLLKKYRRFGIVQEGETYLYFPYAYDFIDDCQKNDIAVTRVEGFFIETGDISGRIDAAFDAASITSDTWDDYRDTCNRDARAFLDTLISNPRLMFRLAVTSQRDWKNSL